MDIHTGPYERHMTGYYVWIFKGKQLKGHGKRGKTLSFESWSICVCACVAIERGREYRQWKEIAPKHHCNKLPIQILSYFTMDVDVQMEAQLSLLPVIKVLGYHPSFPVDCSWIYFYKIWCIKLPSYVFRYEGNSSGLHFSNPLLLGLHIPHQIMYLFLKPVLKNGVKG